MKNLILIFGLMLGLTACGGDSGSGASSTNTEQKGAVANEVTTVDGETTITDSGLVAVAGDALNTPFSTGISFVPEASLGAEFDRDTSGFVFLTNGYIETSQAFGFGPDCVVPAGTYTLSTEGAGVQASKDHHYQGIVIEGVGPVNFTAAISNVSAKDFQGTWKMQGAIEISHVGNRSCTGFGIPMTIYFTF